LCLKVFSSINGMKEFWIAAAITLCPSEFGWPSCGNISVFRPVRSRKRICSFLKVS